MCHSIKHCGAEEMLLPKKTKFPDVRERNLFDTEFSKNHNIIYIFFSED